MIEPLTPEQSAAAQGLHTTASDQWRMARWCRGTTKRLLAKMPAIVARREARAQVLTFSQPSTPLWTAPDVSREKKSELKACTREPPKVRTSSPMNRSSSASFKCCPSSKRAQSEADVEMPPASTAVHAAAAADLRPRARQHAFATASHGCSAFSSLLCPSTTTAPSSMVSSRSSTFPRSPATTAAPTMAVPSASSAFSSVVRTSSSILPSVLHTMSSSSGFSTMSCFASTFLSSRLVCIKVLPS
mmetsp:Transcript_24958/g.69569  ORF Transcript_24958/g.69569 Transcript_24958/m.69569 type:complete len:245 (+) Transcript_24958:110-844(+)